MSFHDVKINLEDKKITTSPYCKPTFSGVYTQFDSFLLSTYKSTHSFIDASEYGQLD